MNDTRDYRSANTAGEVLQALFIALIADAKAHVPAVLVNNDIEELHGYRVTLRRMRSILEEFHGCMDPDIYTLLKAELKAMVSPTNPLRDMDVFLENVKEYRLMAQPQFEPAFDLIESKISEEREESFNEVKQFVKSSEYVNMLSVITDLSQTDKFYSSCSRNDIKTVVRKNMQRRYKGILKATAKLDKKSNPSSYHRLRIDIKKLRYTLETFAHLFPKKTYRKVAKSLKSLQDNLGRHQDLAIQLTRLHTLEEPDQNMKIILAVLSEEQAQVRKKARKKLKKLSDKPFQKEFKALFS